MQATHVPPGKESAESVMANLTRKKKGGDESSDKVNRDSLAMQGILSSWLLFGDTFYGDSKEHEQMKQHSQLNPSRATENFRTIERHHWLHRCVVHTKFFFKNAPEINFYYIVLTS
jgi:hypothetical protein